MRIKCAIVVAAVVMHGTLDEAFYVFPFRSKSVNLSAKHSDSINHKHKRKLQQSVQVEAKRRKQNYSIEHRSPQT